MSNEHRIKVGKYEFVRPVPNYGQRLDIFSEGAQISTVSADRNDAIALMMEQLDAARTVVQGARDAMDAPTLRRKEFLRATLESYDSLVYAHESPSSKLAYTTVNPDCAAEDVKLIPLRRVCPTTVVTSKSRSGRA